MKQILGVVDFSEATEKVLEVAADLANTNKANLIVLFPYRLIHEDLGGDMVSLKKKLESEARIKFQVLRDNLHSLEKTPREFHPEIGFLAGRLSSYLAKKNIDMVVIGERQMNEANNKHSPDLQNLISASTIPFVIVPGQISAATLYTVQKQL